MTLPAVPAAVGQARRTARDFACSQGADAGLVADVALAVSEACTNAVRHSGASALVLELACMEGELQVRVVDRGRGVYARAEDPGAGLGLSIIARIASRVELRQPASGGTELSMAFALAS